ncbi:myoglobin-like [Protopterus annectens]
MASAAQWDTTLKFWEAHVAGDLKKHGHEALVRLFLKNKDSQKHFPKFKDLASEAEMRGSDGLKNHGETVFTALGKALQQRDGIANELRPLAVTHSQNHKIPLEEFENICEVIDVYLAEICPDYAGETRTSVKAVLDVFSQSMTTLYGEV